ncbi:MULTISPECIES: phosphoribosyltransferase [Flavobacteriaceae]|uniref:Phosphoribosyltransferase n=2 Tax=Flavobacteriaceae TaxID=49546 RepID=A0A4Y8AUW7_9FLAO|nr:MULTISPECIES: phosphoribosyltransferase family protein [Flavobacteriaceae]TEW76343.1 phosphoribosyltransferase [Gramella jeungdoensis]GGK52104.1 phosphoribosyltransferase [Lutibacter litoralis]
MMFKNREEAGILLADKLVNYSNKKDTVIVAIPRGGVPVGYQICKKLNLPLEIVLSKKIGHPFNKEYAIGAVTLDSYILSEAVPGISNKYIEKEIKKIRGILKQRQQLFYGSKKTINLKNKTVIIVDDGVATGNTLIASIELIKIAAPIKIIVALPVAPPSALKRIKALSAVYMTICLLEPRSFQAVGQFFEEFKQVDDTQVIDLLKRANANLKIDELHF